MNTFSSFLDDSFVCINAREPGSERGSITGFYFVPNLCLMEEDSLQALLQDITS